MEFVKKLIKLGNGFALLIPKELREYMGINENSEIIIKDNADKSLTLTKK